MTEENLSDKWVNAGLVNKSYLEKDIKEAVKKLKEGLDDKKICCVYIENDDPVACTHGSDFVKELVNKIFGEKLTK